MHIYLPNVDGMESKSLSSYAFIVFTSSFASVSNQYSDYSYFLARVLESREKILSLTCEQAEIILMFLAISNASHHQDYIEKLLYQIYSVCHRKRFLTRNLYFNEVLLNSMIIRTFVYDNDILLSTDIAASKEVRLSV
jgi:hypothetical protein